MKQQRVYSATEIEYPKHLPEWMHTEAWQQSVDRMIEENQTSTCASCYMKKVHNMNGACHANMNYMVHGTHEYLLNVHPLGWDRGWSKEVKKAFHNWLVDPKSGPWGIAFGESTAVILDEDDVPKATLFLNIGNTPIKPVVHYCISSRLYSEHGMMINHTLNKHFAKHGDIALAVLLAHHYPRLYNAYHSSYDPTLGILPKPWVVGLPEKELETFKELGKSTYIVNEIYQTPYNKEPYKSEAEFVEGYHELLKKGK